MHIPGLTDPNLTKSRLHMGEVPLRRADFLQLGRIDVLHHLGLPLSVRSKGIFSAHVRIAARWTAS